MTMEMPDDSYVAALAFGMLPAPLMEMCETQIKEKLQREACRHYEMDPTEKNLDMIEPEKKQVAEIMHEISLALYRVASEEKLLVV